jgi:hypothetical protein
MGDTSIALGLLTSLALVGGCASSASPDAAPMAVFKDGDWPSSSDVRATGFDSWTLFDIGSGDDRFLVARAYRTSQANQDGTTTRTKVLEVDMIDPDHTYIRGANEDEPFTLRAEVARAIAADLSAMEEATGKQGQSGAIHTNGLYNSSKNALLCVGDSTATALLGAHLGLLLNMGMNCGPHSAAANDGGCQDIATKVSQAQGALHDWESSAARRCGSIL